MHINENLITMKRKLIITACFAVLFFTACQQEDVDDAFEKLPVSIEANIGDSSGEPVGRYVGNEPNQAAFATGDEIGLMVNEGSFVKWTYDGSKWSPTGNAVYWKDKVNNHQFYAFYPYKENGGMSLANVPMPNLLGQDGSMVEVAKRDFLVTTKTQAYGSNGVVSFTKANGAPFTHVSSLVQIVIKGGGDLKNATITGIAIEGDGITTLSSYSFDDDKVSLDTDSENASDELLAEGLNRQVNSTDQTFYFIVNAGTVALSEMDLTIGYTSGNKTYKAELQGMGSSNVKLERGKLYNYTLKISDGVLTMTGNEIKEWETGNNVGEIIINGEEQQDE